MDDEDEDDEDGDGSEEDDEHAKKAALGKRKAPSKPQKPPRKGPEKKARREYASNILVLSLNGFISSGGPRVEVEYEHEMESVPLTKEAIANW